MITLSLVSFLAGVLTVLAPCVLPLLPVIIGGTAARADADAQHAERRWFRPLIIAASLAVSVTIFTLLLKGTTALLGVPAWVWTWISGGILVLLGLTMLLPEVWDRISAALRLQSAGGGLLNRTAQRDGLGGDILLGAALGPAFTSCSPTYALIVATVLPVSLAEGALYTVLYAVGLALALMVIALAGSALVRRLGWLADPRGVFRRVVGGVLIVVGVLVAIGFDRAVQAWVLEQGWYDPISNLEHFILG
ncbi:thiol-disulfide oxidoreductase-associated membrane protein CcdA2 [Microbacterium sediminicola]|uniref:Thiol-disulfide oxidoreductase-associated membrane protein CcdA2 n=1 Tax=Microbacterium sediminicola TaxID=415210 RepID=A0ABP4UFZ3_9MICO